MKNFKIDCYGNIITGITAILILATIISSIILITTITYINDENSASVANDNFRYIITDYKNNLNKLLLDSIIELSEDIVEKRTPSKNSPDDIKRILNEKLNQKEVEYNEKYGINIESEALIVENTSDPSNIQSKIKISATKESQTFNDVITVKANIEGLKDPLPILKCGYHPSFSYNETRISYNEALYDFLLKNGCKNPEGYINASSPLIIKKCPYDPYIHHGDSLTLKNCIDNGYYHESADGSCYLCRLEGKGKCPHYGFEVFIKPGQNNINQSISASDHVIFFEQYPGDRYYYSEFNSIFLDSSHKSKYGLI